MRGYPKMKMISVPSFLNLLCTSVIVSSNCFQLCPYLIWDCTGLRLNHYKSGLSKMIRSINPHVLILDLTVHWAHPLLLPISTPVVYCCFNDNLNPLCFRFGLRWCIYCPCYKCHCSFFSLYFSTLATFEHFAPSQILHPQSTLSVQPSSLPKREITYLSLLPYLLHLHLSPQHFTAPEGNTVTACRVTALWPFSMPPILTT